MLPNSIDPVKSALVHLILVGSIKNGARNKSTREFYQENFNEARLNVQVIYSSGEFKRR